MTATAIGYAPSGAVTEPTGRRWPRRIAAGLLGVGLAGLFGGGALVLLTDIGGWSLRSSDEEALDDEVSPFDREDLPTQTSPATSTTEPTSTTEASATTEPTPSTRRAGDQTAPVEVTGDPLTPMPTDIRQTEPATDPSYGAVAPTLTGTDFDGNEVVIGPDGKAKAIYFLTHWCPHCQREAPLVQRLVDSGQVPDDLEIYAVSTSVDRGRGNFPASTWLLDEVGFTSPVVRDDNASAALAAFGNAGFPFVVYLDRNHRVVARSSGELGSDAIAQMWELTAAAPATVVDQLLVGGRYLEHPRDAALEAALDSANEAGVAFAWLDRSGGSETAIALADDYAEELGALGSPFNTVLVLLDDGFAGSSLTVAQTDLDEALDAAFDGFRDSEPGQAVAAFVSALTTPEG